MVQIKRTRPYLVGDFEQGGWTKNDQNCAQAVLKAYTSAMQSLLDQASAFQAAVLAYRARHPDTSENAARCAVASILCGKPQ